MVSYISRVSTLVHSLPCLNLYCSGRWSHTANAFTVSTSVSLVLILIVVEDGLVRTDLRRLCQSVQVLILVVMEDGLVRLEKMIKADLGEAS